VIVRRRAAIFFLFLCAGSIACGDRSPPALWPEPLPPALAEPIGVADPSTAAPSASGTVGDPKVEPAPAKPEPKPEPEPADAKQDQ